MSPDDRWRLQHMADAAEQALAFAAQRQREDLDRDTMLAMALTRAVEIVGEAAARVGESGRAEPPGIPWPAVVGMRNRLVHACFDVDLDILWDTVHLALPALLAQLRPALQTP